MGITCDEKYNETVIIRARTRLQLVAHIRGKPEPTITWHKDNIPMIEEDRLVFNEKDQVYSMTMSQPVRDDSGVYKVHAENEHGEEFKNVTIQVLDRPNLPQSVELVDITKTSMTLLWKPPTDNGGAEITNYIVERREVGRNVWSKLSTTIEPKVFVAPEEKELTDEEKKEQKKKDGRREWWRKGGGKVAGKGGGKG